MVYLPRGKKGIVEIPDSYSGVYPRFQIASRRLLFDRLRASEIIAPVMLISSKHEQLFTAFAGSAIMPALLCL